MKESEVTGYSEEGCCDEPRGAVGYELETVYEAHVNTYVSIYFMFSRRQNVKRVSIMRSDVSDGIWTNYTLGTVTEIHHNVPLGMWILRIHVGCQPDWLFKDKSSGNLRTPTVSRAWGKHHPDEKYMKDDMVDAFGYATTKKEDVEEEVKQVIDWHKMMKAGEKRMKEDLDKHMFSLPLIAAKRRRQGVITNIKEVKSKMLQLIDVIFFNRKTKEIDFRKEIVAVDIEEAYMLAAQEYGKYNSKVHMRHANCLFSFVEDNKE